MEPVWSIEELLSESDAVTDLSEEDLRRLATLAALKIPESQVKSLCRDLDSMNHFVAAIKKVDVSDVPGPVVAANVDFPLQPRADNAGEGVTEAVGQSSVHG